MASTGKDKTSLLVTTKNESGALYNLLKPILDKTEDTNKKAEQDPTADEIADEYEVHDMLNESTIST